MSEPSSPVENDRYVIRDEASLRSLYDQPRQRVVAAKVSVLTDEIKDLIRAARFVCLASEGASGLDVSPRGGSPGVVHVIDDRTVAIPDMLGNNKLETLTNIVNGDGRVALLFLLTGIDFFVRINGKAHLSTDPNLLGQLQEDRARPVRVAIVVHTDEVYAHCSKATVRSQLWEPEGRLDGESLPDMARTVDRLVAMSDATTDRPDD